MQRARGLDGTSRPPTLASGFTERVLAAALLLGVLLTPALASATPSDLVGFGARTPGLGLTGVSHGDGFEAGYQNPALLAASRRRSLLFGASAAAFDLRLDDSSARLEPARGTTIGFVLPLPFGDVLQDRLVLGGGFYTPVNVLLRGNVRFTEVPQWPVVDRAQSLAIHLGIGFDFHGIVDGLRIGVGTTVLATLVGDLTVQLDETNAFQSVVETQLLATFAPVVGASYSQRDFGFGVVYRHELRADMNLRIVTQDLPVTLPVLTIGGLIQYDPGQLALEAYYRPIPELRLIANATARFWSTYPGAAQPTSASSYRAPSADFHDTISPRVAVEGTLRSGPAQLQLRAGYALELSPAPVARFGVERNPDGTPHVEDGAAVSVPVRVIDNDRHIATVGVGFAYALSEGERLTLDVYGQAHFLASRTHAIALASDDPTAAALVSSGIIYAGGWALGLEF